MQQYEIYFVKLYKESKLQNKNSQVMKARFNESQSRFEKLTDEKRKSCMWQEFPKNKNFYLECWIMIDGSVSIFQIFADNRGFIEFKQMN